MDDHKDIASFRKAIDRLDDELLRLLNERSRNVIEIGKLKKRSETDAHLHTPRREAEIIERLTQENTGPFPNDAIRSVYREIMSASLSLEGPQKVAYLGPPATFTHLACLQKFGNSAHYVPVTSIKEVFNEVERGRVHFGIVHVLFRKPEQVKKNEQVITQVEFVPIDELKQRREQMESWSQLCLDHIDALLEQAKPA